MDVAVEIPDSVRRLQTAAATGDATTITEILALGDVDVNSKDESGATALHKACGPGDHVECLKLLIKTAGINVNAQDNSGATPMHVACTHGSLNCLQILVRNGGDAKIRDNENRTPMDIAVHNDRQLCCDVLVEFAGADVSQRYSIFRKPSQVGTSTTTFKTDKYGFIIPDSTSSNSNSNNNNNNGNSIKGVNQKSLSEKAIKKLEERDISRAKKWAKMLKDWPEEGRNRAKRAKIKERCRKGIPHSMRGEAWMALTRAKEIKKKNDPSLYERLKNMPSSDAKQIDLDINRTLRDHSLFKERYGKAQSELFYILIAYSNYNKTVGYVQGMSGITGFLYLQIQNEEDTFWTLVQLFNNYSLEGLYLAGFPSLLECFYIHERLLHKYLPRLATHLEKENIVTSMYASKWYLMILFASFPYEVTLRVWDVYLSEGYKVIFSTIMAFFRMYEDALLAMNFEKLLQFLNHENTTRLDIDVEKLLKLALKNKVKNRKLKKYQREYFEKQEKEGGAGGAWAADRDGGGSGGGGGGGARRRATIIL